MVDIDVLQIDRGTGNDVPTSTADAEIEPGFSEWPVDGDFPFQVPYVPTEQDASINPLLGAMSSWGTEYADGEET